MSPQKFSSEERGVLGRGRKSVALVVFLRGVNVGGRKRFQPSVLARELSDFDVVNVGAAGTFVIRKPISQTMVRAGLLRRLPFTTEVMICQSRDVIHLASPGTRSHETSRHDVRR